MGTSVSKVITCDCVKKLSILESKDNQKIQINQRNSQSSIETRTKFTAKVT